LFFRASVRASVLVVLVPAAALVAQATQASRTRAVAEPVSMPVRAAYVNATIHLDGILNEPAWHALPPTTQFVQRDPAPGAPPTHATEVRMLLTDDAVIIGARMYDDKSAMFSALGPPSDGAAGGYLSDYFEVQIDAHHDHVAALDLAIAPGGGRRSWLVTRDGTRDTSWDIQWEGATHLDDSGWTAEIRIPLSEFHVKRGTESWGVEYVRFSWRRQETDVFQAATRAMTAFTAGGDVVPSGRP
jgi:hypothetical protein